MMVEIPVTKDIVSFLIDARKLRWPQRADNLAIGKAIASFMDDWSVWVLSQPPTISRDEFNRREREFINRMKAEP